MAVDLLCPIPYGPGHYKYIEPVTTDSILNLLRNRKKPTHDEFGFPILKSSLAQFKRLFKQRKHRVVRGKRKAVYAIFNENSSGAVAVVETKKEAMALLKKDVIRCTVFGRKLPSLPDLYNVSIGTTVIKVPVRGYRRNIDTDNYVNPKDPNFCKHRVAVKRCGECPRSIDANAQYCPCSLIARIKTSGPNWTFWSDHQIRMYLDKRKEPNTINIKMSLGELLE
jgi:hypothetical protein